MTIAIVGAGISGLACADALRQRGFRTRLFEKSRGVGGRMATRRTPTAGGEAAFDHGAQYFTARAPDFAARVAAWVEAGVAAPWTEVAADAFVGVPGMNAPAKAMAGALDVRCGARIASLSRVEEGWRLSPGGGETYTGVVIALPAEQAADLAAVAAPDLAQQARRTVSGPCWTLMAAFEQPLSGVSDWLRTDGPIGWAARNRAKPGRAGPEAWVVQASEDWSRAHLEAPEAHICETLLAAFASGLGRPPPPLLHQGVHRWRYARSGALGVPFLLDADAGLGLCGDWLLGPRVEAAWRSGSALGQAFRPL